MPAPRISHGFRHDIFVSYTHGDNEPDGTGRRWVSQFVEDLKVRLSVVSGASIDIWQDAKLGAADRFDDAIREHLNDSAVLLVVLSPLYFNSDYCKCEREQFCSGNQDHFLGSKGRVVKAAKYYVPLEQYPPDLAELLELCFYREVPGTSRYREYLLDEDPTIRSLYHTRVDDVAQEAAAILRALATRAPVKPKGTVYLAESTSDLQPACDDVRRCLSQLGYESVPRTPLRLLDANGAMAAISQNLEKSKLSIHPVGAYYGQSPEGSDGRSLVQLQVEAAARDARNGSLQRIIWVPEGMEPKEELQQTFLNRLRTEYADRGFELFEQGLSALKSHVENRLEPRASVVAPVTSDSGVYVVCDSTDRAVAKKVRLFLFSEKLDVEWTPLTVQDLGKNPQHLKLLERNRIHVVVHGNTDDAWIQDRIRELVANRAVGRHQAIFLGDPKREDKDEILVRDVELIPGYDPLPVADALQAFVKRIQLAAARGGKS